MNITVIKKLLTSLVEETWAFVVWAAKFFFQNGKSNSEPKPSFYNGVENGVFVTKVDDQTFVTGVVEDNNS